MFKLALPVPGCRTGRIGQLPVDADYMVGVKARARMLAKACQYKGVEDDQSDVRQGALPAATVEK